MGVVVFVLGLLVSAKPGHAHPHGFVDGGVDFLISDSRSLVALRVTWLLDEFESLYMLSAANVGLGAGGELDDADRVAFTEQMRIWLSDFAGSAHPLHNGMPVALHSPAALEVDVVDGRLKMTFERPLIDPLPVSALALEVGFYEGSYFYAHSVTQPSRILGADTACSTRTHAHDPDAQYETLQATLRQLGREDVPDDLNVGALFADRIVLTCD